MQKYFINKIVNDEVSFLEEDKNHLLKVMRIAINDKVIAIHQHQKYLVKIISLDPLRAKIIENIIEDTKNPFNLNVFVASIKTKHLELAITKATELNVNHFYIFYSHRSQQQVIHNKERYLKIIKEAAQQANRNDLMELSIIKDKATLITLLKQNNINIIADFINNQNNLEQSLNKTADNIGVIIGPEGGFDQEDYQTIFNHINYLTLSLTKTILRAETAMIYVISVISYLCLRN